MFIINKSIAGIGYLAKAVGTQCVNAGTALQGTLSAEMLQSTPHIVNGTAIALEQGGQGWKRNSFLGLLKMKFLCWLRINQ